MERVEVALGDRTRGYPEQPRTLIPRFGGVVGRCLSSTSLGPCKTRMSCAKPLLPCKVGHGGAELPAGDLALCGRWRPDWFRVARHVVVDTVPALVHLLLRVARCSRPCASVKGRCPWVLGGLLPHFSAPVLRIAQRVSAS